MGAQWLVALLRRFGLQHLGQEENPAEIAGLVRDHERCEDAGLLALQSLVASAMFFEQIDKAEGRGIMLLVDLLSCLLAHPLGEIGPRGLESEQGRHKQACPHGFLLGKDGLAGGPAKLMMRRDELIGDPRRACLARTEHAAGKHRRHRVHRAGLTQPAGRAVEARDNTKLHLGQAEPCALFAVYDTIMAGERKFEAAAKAKAVNGGYRRHGQSLDPVEQRRHGVDGFDDLIFSGESVEFLDIGAGDEALVLAGHDHEANHGVVARAILDR